MNLTIDIDGDNILLTRFSGDKYETMDKSAEVKLTPEIEAAIDAVIRLIEGEQE